MMLCSDWTGYKIGAAGQRRQCIDRLQARDNSNMWTLGKRNAENALNVFAKEYEGQVLIHIRQCFKATGEDRWYPTKKGITLNLEEWDKFTEVFSEVDSEVRQLRSKNEEAESGLKEIYCQHLVGIMSECVCGTSSNLMHNVCTLQKLDPIHYCIYFARDFVDEVVITEQYGTEVGLAALEWLDIHTTDGPLEE